MKSPSSFGESRWQDLRQKAESPLGQASVGSVSTGPLQVPQFCGEPEHLPGGLPPVSPFDPKLLPDVFRPWIEDVADRMQCPIDFPAVAAMVALATIVGRQVAIRPKRYDDWTVVPNLWGMAVGRPGVMKTPGLQEPLRPLRALEVAAKAEYDRSIQASVADGQLAKLRKSDAEKKARKSLADPGEAKRILMESLPSEDDEPVRKRYILNDPTVEKLGVILNQNPRGVLVYRDELVGFLKSLDRQGQEGARSFYLEAWAGTGSFTYDRIERGTIDIESATVSIIGGIQPGPLADYISSASRMGQGDDGLMQRFQLAVYPDISPNWRNIDREPNREAQNRAYAVFNRLDVIDAELIGADHDRFDVASIPYLRLDTDGQAEFDTWRGKLEREVRGGHLHPALESHISKYRSLVPSLALLVHLADNRVGPVTAEAVQTAIGWCDHLRPHARRIYSFAIQPDVASALALGRHLLEGDLPDGFALRDVYRKGWSGLGSVDQSHNAARVLIEHNWLAELQTNTPGRPATTYHIHPRLRDSAAAKSLRTLRTETDTTDTTPRQGRSVSSVSPLTPPPTQNHTGEQPGEAA